MGLMCHYFEYIYLGCNYWAGVSLVFIAKVSQDFFSVYYGHLQIFLGGMTIDNG